MTDPREELRERVRPAVRRYLDAERTVDRITDAVLDALGLEQDGRVPLAVSGVEATFLRHAISVALRSPEFDDQQRDSLLSVSERLAPSSSEGAP